MSRFEIPHADDWDAMERALLAIQSYMSHPQVGTGKWIDVPYAGSLFTTNTGGSITVAPRHPYVYQYVVVGDMLVVQVSLKVTVNNAGTTDVRIALPNNLLATPYADPGDENRVGGWAVWNGGAVAGAALAAINAAGNYIRLLRWDGTAAAAYPNATDCFFRFTLPIRIQARR